MCRNGPHAADESGYPELLSYRTQDQYYLPELAEGCSYQPPFIEGNSGDYLPAGYASRIVNTAPGLEGSQHYGVFTPFNSEAKR